MGQAIVIAVLGIPVLYFGGVIFGGPLAWHGVGKAGSAKVEIDKATGLYLRARAG